MLVKLQRPPPEMRIFFPARFGSLEHRHAPPALTRFQRAHQPCGAAAEDYGVKLLGQHVEESFELMGHSVDKS